MTSSVRRYGHPLELHRGPCGDVNKKSSERNFVECDVNQSTQYSHSKQSQSSARGGNFYQETDQEVGISGNADIVPR